MIQALFTDESDVSDIRTEETITLMDALGFTPFTGFPSVSIDELLISKLIESGYLNNHSIETFKNLRKNKTYYRFSKSMKLSNDLMKIVRKLKPQMSINREMTQRNISPMKVENNLKYCFMYSQFLRLYCYNENLLNKALKILNIIVHDHSCSTIEFFEALNEAYFKVYDLLINGLNYATTKYQQKHGFQQSRSVNDRLRCLQEILLSKLIPLLVFAYIDFFWTTLTPGR